MSVACINPLSAQNKKDNSSKPPRENPDPDFVFKAIESGLAEIALGKLGQDRGQSAAVKNYGKMMVEDHSKANAELKQLADKHNFETPTQLPQSVQKNSDALKKLSGVEFDKAFMEQMIKDHKKAIFLFEEEAEKGKNDAIRLWAQKTLPALKQHLEEAINIYDNLK